MATDNSTMAIEDGIGWGHETTLATITDARLGNEVDADTFREMCARISSHAHRAAH
jgi:hypothetical protein